MEAAQLQINLQSKHEAGQRYVDAGNCFKKTDVEGKFHNSVNCDRPGECSPEKDCLR